MNIEVKTDRGACYEAAIAYSRRGWHVFPCKADRRPRVRDWNSVASTNPAVIREWWMHWPDAAIGMAQGPSGTLGIDLDVKHGKNGIESFSTICQNRRIPLSGALISLTPSGGRHYIFSHDHGRQRIGNSVSKVLNGVDIRGDGGYLILPPSVVTEGCYECLNDWSSDLVQAPDELVDLILEACGRQEPAPLDTVLLDSSFLQKECRAIEGTPVGGRNNQLFISSARSGAAIGLGLTTSDRTAEVLGAAARSAGLDETEIRATIASGIRHGMECSVPVIPEVHSAKEIVCTDAGNSALLAVSFRGLARFVPEMGGWLVYDGVRWQKDRQGQIMTQAKLLARSLSLAGVNHADDSLMKWGRTSQSRRNLESMIALSTSEPGVGATPELFDADQYLLNCQNGTVDLRSLDLRAHTHTDLITRVAGTHFDPKAECPRWEMFLHDVMVGNSVVIDYLQKAVGYSLTGDTTEQCFFFLYGDGANGKSTFINTISKLMGNYAAKTRAESLLVKKTDGPSNDIARLHGARFVSASEMKHRPLNETLIKDITGGDAVTARFLYAEYMEFLPACKIWMYGNEKPSIRGIDEAIWRRIRLIPFCIHIPEEKQDKKLAQSLAEELPGILNWALAGLRKWQTSGLGSPLVVREAVEVYREEMDSVGQFIESECEVGPLHHVEVTSLYGQYRSWSASQGCPSLPKTTFGASLEERGYTRARDTKTGRFIRWGLQLRTEIDSTLLPHSAEVTSMKPEASELQLASCGPVSEIDPW